MRYYKIAIYTVALFLAIAFTSLLFPVSVKAITQELVPYTMNSATQDTVLSFMQSMASDSIAQREGLYCPTSDINSLNGILNNRSVLDSLQYRAVSNASLSNVDFGNLVDSNGNIVPYSATKTVYGVSDLGRFTYLVDTSGNIVNIKDYQDNVYSSLNASPDSSISFPQFIIRYLTLGNPLLYEKIAEIDFTAIGNDSMVVLSNVVSPEDAASIQNYEFHLKMDTNNGWSVYVPNTCSLTSVCTPTNGIYEYKGSVGSIAQGVYFGAPSIFTNDLSSVFFTGNTSTYGYFNNSSTSYYGQNYAYTCAWHNSYNVLGNGGYLDFKAPSVLQFNRLASVTSQSAVYLQPVNTTGDTTDVYNYTLNLIRPVRNTTINNNYNETNPISYNNYPVTNNFSYPSYYSDTNSYITNIYNYYTTPSPSYDLPSIDTDNITGTDIPFFNNLQYRFPFSIPWDLQRAIALLTAQPEPPAWDFYWNITAFGQIYSYHCVGDLSAFSDLAGLLRTLETLAFVIALALFSYKCFF